MASRLVQSVQSYLKIKGFNPGPLDGIIGDQTVASWNRFLDAEEAAIAEKAKPAPRPVPTAANPSDTASGSARAKLLARAVADVGKLSTRSDVGTDRGNLGCADAVTRILHDELAMSIALTLSTDELYEELKKANWKLVDPNTPGAVVVSPSNSHMHGHTGIVGDEEKIYSNSSATGLWSQNYTINKWLAYFARCGTYMFVPLDSSPSEALTSGTPTPSTGTELKPLGVDSAIHGQFAVSESQLVNAGREHAPSYEKYCGAIIENSQKYSINPVFVLADLVNQNVKREYNNPWGISADHYPYGPNGSQLGEPNGHVKNGPRKFSDSEWRIAFDRQFSVVASPDGPYKSCKTIKEWALIDAPPGAENDVHGTNSEEGADVGGIYNKLVESLA